MHKSPMQPPRPFMQAFSGKAQRADVWLGEAALALVRAADYDIPAMRRAAARAQQQLGDLERRRADCTRSAAAAARAYQQARPPRLLALLGLSQHDRGRARMTAGAPASSSGHSDVHGLASAAAPARAYQQARPSCLQPCWAYLWVTAWSGSRLA